MKILITGPKCSGKSTIGANVADFLGIQFFETDDLIEKAYSREHNHKLSFYEICEKLGEPEFRRYEQQAVKEVCSNDWCVISAGGSTLLHWESRKLLRQNAVVVLLNAETSLLWERIVKIGKSKYLQTPSPKEHFQQHVRLIMEVIEPFADIILDISENLDVTSQAVDRLAEHLATVCSSPNSLGEIIRLTTFGESHGPAVGAVLDGVQPGINICAEDIQAELNRRRPGQSKVSTQRNEPDKIKILSGIFEGKTTGTPIAMIIENRDQDSTKYDLIRHLFRPGHADFTFWKKYGLRDYKGGGRSSGRETAARVAGGAFAKKILKTRNVDIKAYSLEIAGVRAESIDLDAVEDNSVRCPDPAAAEKMQKLILKAREDGDSVGGIVELKISGAPAGLGDPVFGKLDARLAGAICSLGAVKAVEFGDGFGAAEMRASEFNDQMKDGSFLTNHAGGIIGGISTGQEIIARLAVKPTPSISRVQKTCNLDGHNEQIKIEGRHDPCIVPRIIPVVESMAALVLLDVWEIQNRLKPSRKDNK
jgi:chorismate synthase